MKRFFAWITALLMLLSLAACSSPQTNTAAASQQASTSETGKSENELIAEENDILAANNALWEKVFASMDKNVTDTTLSSNYGDILMNVLDHAKDQFTDEEYAALKADADKIREIETQIAALPQDEAASQSMTQTASTFPQFEGKDLDGNSVSSSLFADNAFTVVNFWFSGCKPCVDEMDDLNALNQRIQEQGGEVIGINTETLDGSADAIATAKEILQTKGATYRNRPGLHSATSILTLPVMPVSLPSALWPSPLPALWIVRATSLGNRLWAVLIKRITLPHCKS